MRQSEGPPTLQLVPPGVVTESDALQAASGIRQRPYMLLFPLGVALSWVGVAHWLLHAIGWLADYRPLLHATVQTQGFLTCMAVGFLFTMIPRRTGTAPPSLGEIVIVVAAPPLLAIAAWGSYWRLVQFLWLSVAITTIRFVVTRFLSAEARRRPPNGFVWIPLAFAVGLVGALMQVLAPSSASGAGWQQIGSGLVQQGLFVALVLGVGSLALPLMTRGQGPPDGAATPRDRLARLAHGAGGLLLVASFWIEAHRSLPVAMALRGGIVLAAFLFGAQIWRRPQRPGWNARLILAAAWMLPVGYLIAAGWPRQFRAGLHVALIGGFALLALAISAQVILGHGGYRERLFGRYLPLAAMALSMGGAIVARALMEIDRASTFLWMGVAAALFLAATVSWSAAVIPGLLRPRVERP